MSNVSGLCPNCLINKSPGKNPFTGDWCACSQCQKKVDDYILIFVIQKFLLGANNVNFIS